MIDRKALVKTSAILVCFGCIAAVIRPAFDAEDDQSTPTVKASDLFLHVKVVGRLGCPLGDVVTVKGIWVHEIRKDVGLLFRITEMDGKKSDQPVEFWVWEVLPFDGYSGPTSPYANKTGITHEGEAEVDDKKTDLPKKSMLRGLMRPFADYLQCSPTIEAMVVRGVMLSFGNHAPDDRNANKIGKIRPRKNEVWELRGFETGNIRGYSKSLDDELEPGDRLRSQGGGYRIRPEFRYLKANRISAK
jgi:hypothetical protein